MRGRAIRLPSGRRNVADLMHFASKVPAVVMQRVMDLDPVAAAREANPTRPPWTGIFAKAFALTAQEFPELRRVYLKFPWPHLYEYPESVAALTIERDFEGEPTVLICTIKKPEALALAEIARVIRSAMHDPIAEVKEFRRITRYARLPWIVRRPLWWLGLAIGRQRANYFGTFAVTSVAAHGAEILAVPTWTTALLTFGAIKRGEPVAVRLIFDHRIIDGAKMARVLVRMEEILDGAIREELRSAA